jgi:disulfide bond formation protein DsbB
MRHNQRYLLAFVVLLTLALVACGGNGSGESTNGSTETVSAGDAENGEELFQQTCSACHGPDAKGLPNLGRDLTENEFIQNNSDQELLEFVKQGRPAGDPANTTGIDMPPKGGNPALTDEQIFEIIAHLRTLQ